MTSELSNIELTPYSYASGHPAYIRMAFYLYSVRMYPILLSVQAAINACTVFGILMLPCGILMLGIWILAWLDAAALLKRSDCPTPSN